MSMFCTKQTKFYNCTLKGTTNEVKASIVKHQLKVAFFSLLRLCDGLEIIYKLGGILSLMVVVTISNIGSHKQEAYFLSI